MPRCRSGPRRGGRTGTRRATGEAVVEDDDDGRTVPRREGRVDADPHPRAASAAEGDLVGGGHPGHGVHVGVTGEDGDAVAADADLAQHACDLGEGGGESGAAHRARGADDGHPGQRPAQLGRTTPRGAGVRREGRRQVWSTAPPAHAAASRTAPDSACRQSAVGSGVSSAQRCQPAGRVPPARRWARIASAACRRGAWASASPSRAGPSAAGSSQGAGRPCAPEPVPAGWIPAGRRRVRRTTPAARPATAPPRGPSRRSYGVGGGVGTVLRSRPRPGTGRRHRRPPGHPRPP